MRLVLNRALVLVCLFSGVGYSEAITGGARRNLWSFAQASWKLMDGYQNTIKNFGLNAQFAAQRHDLNSFPLSRADLTSTANDKVFDSFKTKFAATEGEDIFIIPGNLGYEHLTADSMEQAIKLLEKAYQLGLDAGAAWVLFSTKHCTIGRARSYPNNGPQGENDALILKEFGRRKGKNISIDLYTFTNALKFAHVVGDLEHPDSDFRSVVHAKWIEGVYQYDNAAVPSNITGHITTMTDKLMKDRAPYRTTILSGLTDGKVAFGKTLTVELEGPEGANSGRYYFVLLAVFYRNVLVCYKLDDCPYAAKVQRTVTIPSQAVVLPRVYSPDAGKALPVAPSGADSIRVMTIIGASTYEAESGVGSNPSLSGPFKLDGVAITEPPPPDSEPPVSTIQPLSIVFPVGGETFMVGQTITFKISSSDTVNFPLNSGDRSPSMLFSPDDGKTWIRIIDNIIGETATWTIPDTVWKSVFGTNTGYSTVSGTCKFRLDDYQDPGVFDIIDSAVTIRKSNAVRFGVSHVAGANDRVSQHPSVWFDARGRLMAAPMRTEHGKQRTLSSGIFLTPTGTGRTVELAR